MKNLFSFYKIFYQLIKIDLMISTHDYIAKCLDVAIWVGLSAFAAAYVSPALGMSSTYAVLIATASIVSNATFDLFDGGSDLVSDYRGEQTITYPLTLPIPAWLIFVKFALGRALYIMSLSILVLPLNKIVLLDRLSLGEINFFKFVLIFAGLHICAGFLVVFASSIPRPGDFGGLTRLWRRIIFPLWWLGGAVFPYFAVNSVFPRLSKVFLLNPFLWANEALRYAVLGSKANALPFWSCLGALCLCTAVLGWWGIARLKSKLDFV